MWESLPFCLAKPPTQMLFGLKMDLNRNSCYCPGGSELSPVRASFVRVGLWCMELQKTGLEETLRKNLVLLLSQKN